MTEAHVYNAPQRIPRFYVLQSYKYCYNMYLLNTGWSKISDPVLKLNKYFCSNAIIKRHVSLESKIVYVSNAWKVGKMLTSFMTSSSKVVFQDDDIKTEGCRKSKLYFETKSLTNVTCIMKTKDPDDTRLTKLEMQRLVIRFQWTKSFNNSRQKNSGRPTSRKLDVKSPNGGHIEFFM